MPNEHGEDVLVIAVDGLLTYARRRGLEVKWRRGRKGNDCGGGFWEVWCDGEPLCSDWTPQLLLQRLQNKLMAPRSAVA